MLPFTGKRSFAVSLVLIFTVLQGCSFFGKLNDHEEPILKIGLVADPQYANQPADGQRQYKHSLRKLNEAVDLFNSAQVDFVQTLGDVIDNDWSSFDSIIPIYDRLNPNIESHHLLGNHDFSIDPSYFDQLLDKLSMPYYYYSYEMNGWRFVILDATDISYFSNPLHQHDIRQVDAFYDKINGSPNAQKHNGAIGYEQQRWLESELAKAELLEQQVIIFSHNPLKPLDAGPNLWNDYEIISIIENSPVVFAFINGHKHSGDYELSNGVHYITIHGMVETSANSFAILSIFENKIVLNGFGNQRSFDFVNEKL